MESSTQSDAGFVYSIPRPAMVSAFELGLAACLTCVLIYLSAKLGLDRVLELRSNPFLSIVFGMFALTTAGAVRCAFPPRSWFARLEFERNCIRLVPTPVLRWIGEPSTELPLPARTPEVLVCRGSKDNLQIGFRLIVRPADGTERDLKVETGGRLSSHQAMILTDGIHSATGIPVRLIKRDRLDDGRFEETPWTPSGPFAAFAGLLKLLFAITPFLGGIAMGILHPEPVIVIAVGITLWLCQTLALFAFAKFSHQKSTMFSKLYWLTTGFTFTASYTVLYFLVSTISRTPTR